MSLSAYDKRAARQARALLDDAARALDLAVASSVLREAEIRVAVAGTEASEALVSISRLLRRIEKREGRESPPAVEAPPTGAEEPSVGDDADVLPEGFEPVAEEEDEEPPLAEDEYRYELGSAG